MSTTSPPGPALVCPGCGSPDVDLRHGLLCGTCAEAASGQPDPLVMPADEFAALKAVAEAAGEQPLTPEEIAGLRERFAAAMADQGPFRVRWKDRAEAAEAKLAAIRGYCRNPGHAYIGHLMAERILAIIGSEEPGDGD
jgi:hypothetical protein